MVQRETDYWLHVKHRMWHCKSTEQLDATISELSPGIPFKVDVRNNITYHYTVLRFKDKGDYIMQKLLGEL